MPDLPPDPEHRRETRPEPGPLPELHGLTPFVVDDAGAEAAESASRDELSEAVYLLTRERDYLRRIRDVQIAEHESLLAEHQEQIEALSDELAAVRIDATALAKDRDRWRERAAETDRPVLAVVLARLMRKLRRLAP